eukprot:scaffold21053_cov42-Attheya_sp.AAC.3
MLIRSLLRFSPRQRIQLHQTIPHRVVFRGVSRRVVGNTRAIGSVSCSKLNINHDSTDLYLIDQRTAPQSIESIRVPPIQLQTWKRNGGNHRTTSRDYNNGTKNNNQVRSFWSRAGAVSEVEGGDIDSKTHGITGDASSMINDDMESVAGLDTVFELSPNSDMISGAALDGVVTATTELIWYYPTHQIVSFVHYLGETSLMGGNYAATVALLTVALRVATTPLAIMSRANRVNQEILAPHLKAFKDARTSGASERTLSVHQTRIGILSRRYKYSLTRSFLYPVVSISTLMILGIGVRGMEGFYPDELASGGIFWFGDLTQPDPFRPWGLSLLSALTLTVTNETGVDLLGLPKKESSTRSLWFWRFFPFGISFLIMEAPAIVFCYWIPFGAMSLAQSIVLSKPSVVQHFGLRAPPSGTIDRQITLIDLAHEKLVGGPLPKVAKPTSASQQNIVMYSDLASKQANENPSSAKESVKTTSKKIKKGPRGNRNKRGKR